MENNNLLTLINAGLSIKRKIKLNDINLKINNDDYIGIYGLNSSGKSLLAEIIGGEIKIDSGQLQKAGAVKTAVVSSAERKRMLEEDRHNDDSEFMEGKTDPGRSVMDIFKQSIDEGLTIGEIRKYVDYFEIDHILKRGIRFLSTGEFRKMMIVCALLSKSDIIIIDDPFTGLDIKTRRNLEIQISEISREVKAMVLLSGRLDDIENANRLFLLNELTLTEFNSASEIKDALINTHAHPGFPNSDESKVYKSQIEQEKRIELIRMNNVGMRFYDERILTDINWTITSGEHWQISGPNGSGKSSLLSLINGDSPKAYGQEIYLFGRKRGSGETVWDIKQKIGYVSGSLQQQHRISQNVLSVVVSGFFDSIGLYDKPNPVQIEQAREWCREFGLDDYLDKAFDSLSEGLKRAVLIIRAIVKHPAVLILDEPCQGLDDFNSEFVLSAARRVISRDHSTLLYVSHDPYYRMTEITDLLELVPHPDGGFTGHNSSL